MAKTSKIVPQKEASSTSWPATEVKGTAPSVAVDEPVPEPPLKMFIPGGCSVNDDFKVEKPSSVHAIARVPNDVPRLKEWVEGIVSHMPYSKHSWRKLSNSRWEARSHGRREEKEEGSEFPELGEKENKEKYRDELIQLEVEAKELAEKRDTYKRLCEQREREAKGLRTELDAARKEHADQVKIFEVIDDELDTVTNGQNPQVKQKIDRIDELRAEMDAIKTAREQLVSVEAQLRATREKAEARSQKIKELQSQLSSAVADRETLAKELKAAKSVAEITKADVDEMVAQYRADAEAAQDRLKDVVQYVKWQSRKEALEEVHARGFELSAEIESIKGLEAEAKKLAYPEDEGDSEG
uniref:Plasminogen-binding group A streptococcal M-like protein PAM n=1 Tax=Nicotiana tabacum TaxID=4097 RepID=A0A1S4DK40_TOBAC|nr:PREDICTED: plasminogen-binding group A streptococcal M-like protein PAM [Nicotiana tabacum]